MLQQPISIQMCRSVGTYVGRETVSLRTQSWWARDAPSRADYSFLAATTSLHQNMNLLLKIVCLEFYAVLHY